jgi:hypothetical protein
VSAEYPWAPGDSRSLNSLRLHPEGLPSINFWGSAGVQFSSLDNGAIDVGIKPTSPPGTLNDVALAGNPFSLGWNYQSFGVWNDLSMQSIHAVTFGAATPASGMPVTGTASFAGKLGGMYYSDTGAGALAAANLTVNVDFSARRLDLSSTGTRLSLPGVFSPGSIAPNLDLTGSLTYAPSSSSFGGTLTNAAGTVSGPTAGRFYGPAAQELGGTFVLKSPTTEERFIGGYGAKR